MRVILRCMAPLAHGSFGESAGNTTLIRRMAIVSLPGMPRVPVVSGNALRGVLRRLVMRDMLEHGLGIATTGKLNKQSSSLRRAWQRAVEEWDYETQGEPPPAPVHWWDRVYGAMVNGGHLDGSENTVNPDRIAALREACPPLSVFGAALYSSFLTGHMNVGFLWPHCQETVAAGLIEERRGAVYLPAEDLVEEVSHVRHVDREEQDPAVSGVTPMPTTVETLATGTVLEAQIEFARHATVIEQGAVAHGLMLLRTLGGQAARGLGAVALDVSPGPTEEYLAWRNEHAAAAVEAVRSLLAPREKPAKKGKGFV